VAFIFDSAPDAVFRRAQLPASRLVRLACVSTPDGGRFCRAAKKVGGDETNVQKNPRTRPQIVMSDTGFPVVSDLMVAARIGARALVVVSLATVVSCDNGPEAAAPSVKEEPSEPAWAREVRSRLGEGFPTLRFLRAPSCEMLGEEAPDWVLEPQFARAAEEIAAVRAAFQTDFDLKIPGIDSDRPLHVVLLATTRAYDSFAPRVLGQKAGATYGILGRVADVLVLRHDAVVSTTTEAATCAFLDRFRAAADRPPARLGLTDEALGGRYAAAKRSVAASSRPNAPLWTYEFGRLRQEWIDTVANAWEFVPRATEIESKLSDGLVVDPVLDRAARVAARLLDVFLRDFAVDGEGRVRFEAPGVYREAWRTILRANLTAGAPPLRLRSEFLALGVDPDEVDERFAAWMQFLVSKRRRNHFRDGRLLRWDEYRNHRGEATGKPDDDLLKRFR
jgi:hypothetical protein